MDSTVCSKKNDMVDTIQTKEGAVAISSDNIRSSTRSTRRGKNKNIPTPGSLVSHLRGSGRKLGEGIADLYEQFEKESPTFFAFFSNENRAKNRYPSEVFLVDQTRVVLDEEPNYYHASYVDGCKQAKQYVLAQAPFNEETANDFFRLVMQCKPEVIIVLMDLERENDETQFIVPSGLKSKKYGAISVEKSTTDKGSSSNISEKFNNHTLIITKEKENGEKIQEKYQLMTFNAWTEDMVIPADDFVKFYKMVHKELSDKPRECSQLVVCPSGAHRAGIWTVFDTEAERLKTKNRIRFSDTIRNIRNQRCNTIDHFELFDGLLNLLVSYAKTQL